MNSKFAAGALSALLYCQGLLGFAGMATVLLKDRAQDLSYSATQPLAQPTAPAL
ncbi:MAG: hypothetical protein H0T56_01825 [Pseudaminobacter sp.]|nr:hypothetical protein [Pseudaminobacter sp.]